MKKEFAALFLFTFIMLILPYSTSLIISEVELNPAGTDSGNEWIELYSENEINLEDYILANADNQELKLNFSFSKYYVYKFKSQWLDNADEKISIKNKDRAIVFETKILNDAYNNDKTWQYCNNEWKFESSTKNSENLCEQSQQNNQEQDNEEEQDKEKQDKTEKDEEQETKENNEETTEKIEQIPLTIVNNPTNNIIKLGNTNKQNQNSIVYKSKSEYIKQYLPYALGISCIILLILLLLIKEKNQENE